MNELFNLSTKKSCLTAFCLDQDGRQRLNVTMLSIVLLKLGFKYYL